MLANQFLEAAAGARTAAGLDELARKLWRAHAEGHLAEAEAEAISEAVEARRAALAGHTTPNPPKAVLGLPRGSGPRPRREKVFGLGRPRALDRNAKVRIMHWARCLSRRTEKGRAYGPAARASGVRGRPPQSSGGNRVPLTEPPSAG